MAPVLSGAVDIENIILWWFVCVCKTDTAAALPVSPEALRLREILADLHKRHLHRRYREYCPLDHAQWYLTIRDEYRALSAQIAARPNPTWRDVVEMSEVLWTSLPKQDRQVPVHGNPNERNYEGRGKPLRSSPPWSRPF